MKLLEHSMEKNYKRQINMIVQDRKSIKKKGDKLYVKCKGYDSIAGLIKKTQRNFIDYLYKNESIFSKTI